MGPMSGFYRDGCCDTGPEDVGSHTVCAVMTAEWALAEPRDHSLAAGLDALGDSDLALA
ncbi:MAG: DUF2237 family protein [Xanthobacteraceae bacterium]